MENKAYAFAAGLFLLLLGLALAASVAWFQGDRTERVHYTVVARAGVPGLNLKAPVKLRGVEVGRVDGIGFDAADPRQILVDIAVDVAAPVTPTTYAQLGLQGVTGLSFVALEEAQPDAPLQRAAAGTRLPLRPSLLDQLAQAGPGLVAGFAETATRLNALLSDEHRAQFGATLSGLQAAAQDTSRLMTTLRPSAQQLPTLLRDADAAAQRADAALRRIEAMAAEGEQLAQALRNRTAVLDRLDAAAAQVQATSRHLELALVGDSPPRTQPLVADLSAASRALEQAARELTAQPQSLVWGRTPRPAGPGEPGYTAPNATSASTAGAPR